MVLRTLDVSSESNKSCRRREKQMMSGHMEIELVKLYVSCLSAATHAICDKGA